MLAVFSLTIPCSKLFLVIQTQADQVRHYAEAEGMLLGVQAFNAMIDKKMAASPVDGLIVYPEGVRPCCCAPSQLCKCKACCAMLVMSSTELCHSLRRAPQHVEA